MALGNIQTDIFTNFKNLHGGRLPNSEEIGEIAIIIFKRMPLIHEAIFRAG
jgi:hypothetical protein